MRTSRTTTFRALGVATSFAVAAWAALAPHAAHAQSRAPAYSCDFESTYCDLMEQSKIGDAPPSSARRSSLVPNGRTGSYAVRLHTEPGDGSVHGSGTWERDDLLKAPDSSYCNQGQDEWWAVSVLYPSDYAFPAPGQGAVMIDFHHNSDGGLPNFSVEARGETGLRIRGYGGSQVNGGQYEALIADPYGAVNNVTRNVWYDYVFHIKWSSNSDGVSEAWLNGRKILTHSGATLYSGISCYLKLANYHDPMGQPSSIVFDRVIRGAGAADVALTPLEGVNAPIGGTPTAPTSPTGTTTGPTSPSAPSGSTGGAKADPSAAMDSSSYTIAAGSRVTFTARIMGNAGTPSGTVSFASDGATIGACGNVPLTSGAATCTTSALAGGQHRITGVYAGDSKYGAAQAGPITQTVTGSAATTATTASSLPASFGMDSSNYSSGLGEAVTFTATIPGVGGTVSFADNGRAISGCSSQGVSSSGLATCSTKSLGAGTHAITGTYSGNGAYAAGVAGPITQAVAATTTGSGPNAAVNVQGLWWGGLPESGWGVNFAQQGSILFATWFTYDEQGQGQWLVMSEGTLTGNNSYSGTLYRTTGPAFGAASFDPSKVSRVPVGSATFAFSDSNNGTLTATVDGIPVTKYITRQVFDFRVPTCAEGAAAGAAPNFQDLWWRVDGAESGWGLNLAHQGDTMFMTWFTYDASGKGMWLIASDVRKQSDGNFSGTLYRTTGPAFDAPAWDAAKVTTTAVGSVNFSFTDANNGVFNYTVDGMSGSKPITRQLFSTPRTVCRAS